MQPTSWRSPAKPGFRLKQLLTAIGAMACWETAKEWGLNRHAVVSILALVSTIVGSLFMGGALWLAQGAHRGAGDAMGIGILVSLGAALILLGLGTALACTVTYVMHLPLRPDAANATDPQVVEPATEPSVVEDASEVQEAVRSKRIRRAWWPFGQRA